MRKILYEFKVSQKIERVVRFLVSRGFTQSISDHKTLCTGIEISFSWKTVTKIHQNHL